MLYFLLIVIFLILFSCLGVFALKSATKKMSLFLIASLIFLPFIGILIAISYHYKNMNPSALILLLIVVFTFVMIYKISRLR